MTDIIGDIKDAVKSNSIQSSNDLKTLQVGDTNLLSTNALSPTYGATGTVIAAQNNIQVTDISRHKDEDDLLEVNWDYISTTSKPFVLDTFSWASTHTEGTTLLSFHFPTDYFTGNHILRNVGNTFLSMRGDLHLVVTVQGTPFSSGALIIYPDFYPFTPVIHVRDKLVREFAIVDVSDNVSTADLIVPFKYFRNGIDPFGHCTSINIDVLVGLAGINSVNATVTCFLENQTFKFLRPQENLAVRTTQGLLNFTTVNNTLSNIQNATLPTHLTGDSLDVTGKMMDDVGIPTNPQSVYIKFNSLNNTDNPHTIEKMSLLPSSQKISTPSTFNNTIDEMSYQHILGSREHYINDFNISTTSVVGTLMTTYNVNPAPISVTSQIGAPLCSLMEYVSSNFKFWRGGIKYKLRFFMNRFQSVKLYIGLFYKTQPPGSFSDWSSSHGAIVDIGGDQREVIVEIPYNSETPWLQVPNRYQNPNNSTDPTCQWHDFSLGNLAIYTLTPMISPTGSPTTLRVFATRMASDDFELSNYTPSSRTAPQGDVLLLSKKSTRTPDYIGDVIPSHKLLMNKWQLALTGENQVITKRNEIVAIFPQDIFTSYTSSYTNTFGSTYCVCPALKRHDYLIHTHYSGGLKVRIEFNLADTEQTTLERYRNMDAFELFCYYINPNMFDFNTDPSRQSFTNTVTTTFDDIFTNAAEVRTPYIAQPINNTRVGQKYIYEVEVPYQRNIKYLSTNSERYADYGYLAFGLRYIGSTAEFDIRQVYNYRVFIKTADDGRFATIQKGRYDITSSHTTWEP